MMSAMCYSSGFLLALYFVLLFFPYVQRFEHCVEKRFIKVYVIIITIIIIFIISIIIDGIQWGESHIPSN